MGIFYRLVRMCKADIHGVMDQLEDKALILKQSLREMEDELDQKENRLNKMLMSREQAQKELDAYKAENEKLEEDMTSALEKGKDDIARLLIKKLKAISGHQEELSGYIDGLDRDISRFRDSVVEQRRQYEQLRLKAKEYFRLKEAGHWESSISSSWAKSNLMEPQDLEVELELLQRKEAMQKAVKEGDRA